MIWIFRNIRQKLAAQNKVAAYMRNAIGEVLPGDSFRIMLVMRRINGNETHQNQHI